MTSQKILVPYNFTGNDEKAIEFVMRTFRPDPEVDITLFHTYVPIPEIEVSDKSVMARMAGNLSYLRQKRNELEAALAAAAGRLIEAGFSEDRVRCIFKRRQKETAQEIIDHAVNGEFSTIVLNHSPGKIRKFFTTSISKKVEKALQFKKIYIVG